MYVLLLVQRWSKSVEIYERRCPTIIWMAARVVVLIMAESFVWDILSLEEKFRANYYLTAVLTIIKITF